MDVLLRTCIYCRSSDLHLREAEQGRFFISCDQCGARGPYAPNHELAWQSQVPLQHDSLLRTVIDEAPDIILLKDWEGRFLLCNRALAQLYNTTPEEMVGKSDADYNANAEQVQFYRENIQAVMRSGQTQVVEELSTNAQTGDVRYFQSIKKPLKGADGSDRILVIAHDVTELKRAYQLIEEKEKRYAYAMDAACEGIWGWDIANNQVRHNSKWCELLGLDASLETHDMEVLSTLIHPDDRNSMMEAVQSALAATGEYVHEQRMLRADGQEIWVYDRGRVVEFSAEGKPMRMVGSITDITERKEAERRLEVTNRLIEETNEQLEHQVAERTAELASLNRELHEQARTDALTGVGNRLSLQDWLTTCRSNRPAVLIMLDVDHFKQVNDHYGHGCGDRVLKAIAQCLQSHVRREDLVARVGGEEFLLLLSNMTLERGQYLAEKLRGKIAQLSVLPDGKRLTASFGVVLADADLFDKAWSQADEALYKAKREGRNRVVVSL